MFEWGLISLGCFLMAAAAWGVLRMKDLYARLHYTSVSASLALIGVGIGGFLYFWIQKSIIEWRFLWVIVLSIMTAPIFSHLVAEKAIKDKIPFQKGTLKRLNKK